MRAVKVSVSLPGSVQLAEHERPDSRGVAEEGLTEATDDLQSHGEYVNNSFKPCPKLTHPSRLSQSRSEAPSHSPPSPSLDMTTASDLPADPLYCILELAVQAYSHAPRCRSRLLCATAVVRPSLALPFSAFAPL